MSCGVNRTKTMEKEEKTSEKFVYCDGLPKRGFLSKVVFSKILK
jgi:hypothetical protein